MSKLANNCLSSKVELDLSPFASEAALLLSNHTNLPSTWYGHVPFAFWIVAAFEPRCLVELGTHHGLSYLSFCQAIDKFHLGTRAYAIDTWKGDEHSGFYGEEVFTELSDVHDSRYTSFSRLVRATFDEAVEHFPDGAIDLLHIDGLHTYQAVKHDFETWRPKLAGRSIVLFHDTNVRERGFGVWKLWRELAESCPHFEFLHAHGLGVLKIGNGFPFAIEALFAASNNEKTQTEVRALFARLGAQVSRQAQVGKTVNEIISEVGARDGRIAELSSEIVARDGRIAELSSEIVARDGRIAELSSEIIGRDARVDALSREISARGERITELEAEATGLHVRVDHLSTQVSTRDQLVQELRAQVVGLNAEIGGLRHQVDAERAACGEACAQAASHAAQIGRMKKSLSWRLTRPLRWKAPRKLLKRLKRAIKPLFERRSPAGAAGARTLLPVTLPPKNRLHRVLFVSGGPPPGDRYRIDNIRSALAPRYFDTIDVRIEDLARNVDEIAHVDLLWLWRVVWDDAVGQAIKRARCHGVRIVFDIDDLMFDPDLAKIKIIDGIRSQGMSEKDVANHYGLLGKTLSYADHCTAPTTTLAHQMRRLFKPTSIIPNGFDRHTLAMARSARLARSKAANDGWLRIGYASGSRTHQRDIAVASRAIADVLAAHPHVQLVLFEHTIDIAEFPELTPFVDRIEWRRLVPIDELPNEYARFDINIAPLEVGNPFCEAKSELKFFEAALAGVVTVASPTRPFREAIRHGETGFLATSPGEWRKCLETLINRPDLRRRMSEAALADVLYWYGPERRSVLVNQLVTRLLAPPPVAAEVARTSLLETRPAVKRIDIPEYDAVYAMPRRCVSRIAIVVPLHNQAHNVGEALNSVAAQTVLALDLIVVDNRSTDESLKVARRWLIANQHKFNHVALLQNKSHEKLSRTRNAGIHYADTELVLPLDADNQLLPLCLERCMALLDETNAAMAYPTIELFGDRTGVVHELDWDASRLQFGNYIGAMAMFRRACWFAVGGYTPLEYGWEDYDLWCKFAEAGFWGVRVPEVAARCRMHGYSMMRTVTEVPENSKCPVSDLSNFHPWLDIVPPPSAPQAEQEGFSPANHD
jgi:glycosyltransferase involved in cell wall biosynthesis/peptidoglycan hydrolase CwlO-like protein